MINRVNMDGVTGYQDYESIPRGGYVCKILGVQVKNNRVGQYLELSCDIAEGNYKDFFKNDYHGQTSEPKKWHCVAFVNIPLDNGTEQDGWTKKSFKTFMDALEESNSGYKFDWDETKLKGKLIGALFTGREYEGRDGSIKSSIGITRWTGADKIRAGKYKLPEDRKLSDSRRSSGSATAPASDGGFTDVSADIDNDLPF